MFDPQFIDIMKYVPPLASGVIHPVPKSTMAEIRDFFAGLLGKQNQQLTPPNTPPSQGPDTPLEGPNG